MIPTLLLAIDFNAPTALGIPLGLLLLIWILYTRMQNQQGASNVSRPGRTGAGHVSSNTMDVALDGEVSESVVLFQHSEAEFVGGECIIHFTVKLKEQGTFVIAGGKVTNRRFSGGYFASRKVSGDVGDTISGAVRCTAFTGTWGIGAFQSTADLPSIHAPSPANNRDAEPALAFGKLEIIRSSAMTGAMYAVKVEVDGKTVGEIGNGGTLLLELPAGERNVRVRGGGMSRTATVNITTGQTTCYQTYFSELGLLGGGLNFKPA